MRIKKEFEERSVTKKVCVKITTICDVCGKEITGEYYNVMMRDNLDSMECQDACSKECLRKLFDEYIEISWNDYNKQQIEIKHHNEPERIYKNEIFS